jgi:peptide/nickel transport system substrate-binding protein
MDFEEIMEAASDGQYKLNKGFQFPGMNYYSEAGAENLNQKNALLSQQYKPVIHNRHHIGL